MAIYRYIVTVNVDALDGYGVSANPTTAQDIANEIDSNLDSVMLNFGIEHFDVAVLSTVDYTPTYAPLSPDGRYQS